MPRKIEVLPYNPGWPVRYVGEMEKVSAGLNPCLLEHHHIGSTAIPGLAAKPTIDILCVVESLEALDGCNQAMIDFGYQPKGENGNPGRRYFQKVEDTVHLFHIHAYAPGHPDILRHLNFRDYLRSHPDEARAYQDLKTQLAQLHSFEPEQYTSGKAAFILAVEYRAAAWRVELGLPATSSGLDNL